MRHDTRNAHVITLIPSKAVLEVAELIDGHDLSISDVLYLAREMMGAAVSTMDPETRPLVLEAFTRGVLADIAEHEQRLRYKVGKGEHLC